MQLSLDVYVWVPEQSPDIFRRFIDSYVNVDDPGDERFHAFMRVHVLGIMSDADEKALDELRFGEGDEAFTLYLKARDHGRAMITVTRDGATVLGLGIEAPDDLSEARRQAEPLMQELRQRFTAPAACAGVELPPAGDHSEWHEDGLVLLRMGELPKP